jgi:hypothetical protein
MTEFAAQENLKSSFPLGFKARRAEGGVDIRGECVTPLLERLGIDPVQPAEVVHYYANKDGTHDYGWWYHLVGQIINGTL